jgi:epidermal growth factor receptor substrate 15
MKKFITLSFILFFSSLSFSQLDEQHKQEFSKKMKDGDMLFSQGKFLEAKRYYEEAAMLNPNDEQVKKQIKFCDANEQKKSGFEADKEYNKLINKADEKFKSGDYQGAKDLFLRATKIKTSDTYPPKMLKQIEDLLNPKTVKTPEPLPDLGQNSDMSIVEAQKALKAADINRKNEKNTKVQQKSEEIEKNDVNRSSNKLKEIEKNNTNFSNINQNLDKINQVKIDAMDSINVKLQHEDNSVNSVSNFQQTYQRDLIGFVDRTLVNENKINDSIQLKNNGIGSKNDTIFFKLYVENDIVNSISVSDFDLERAETKKKINIFESKDEKKISDNIISKQEVAELLTETNENIQVIDNKLSDKLIKNMHKTIDKNVEFSKKENSRGTENIKNIKVNQEKFSVTDKKNSFHEDSLLISSENRRNKFKDTLYEKYYKNESDMKEKIDSSRTEVNYQMKASIKVYQNEIYDIENAQKTNRQELVSTILKAQNQRFKSEDSLNKIINISSDKLNSFTKKNQDLASENNSSEIKDINNSFVELSNLETESNRFTSQGTTKPSDAKSSIEIIEHKIQNFKNTEADNVNRKTLENKNVIEEIEKKGRVFDDKAANDIGSVYPEGVTQEQFNKTDDKGSLLAVVTRRIIVKNGYGQIYTRTQSKDFITYSKNGIASTEAIWQKETQDAKLKKN